MKLVLAMLAFAAGSCGFRPLYEKTAFRDVSARSAKIAIPPVAGYDGTHGVDLRNELAAKLTPRGRPENPAYVLRIKMAKPHIYGYTMKPDGTESSYMVRISASYVLSGADGGKVVMENSASAQLSYNILKDQYSSEALKNNAIKLIVKDLADQIYIAVITALAEG
ncbi:MAG: LPS assembly lipoprotein LptE [Rickettsiales bacterium]|jgi:hypothetical protein|nr:LPS assembly lipoprotein LptE [Rickettsiales bacterium]